jgi:hypothetical protein
MDRGNKSMIRNLAVLALIFLMGSAHAAPTYDEGVTGKLFLGTLIESSSDKGEDGEPAVMAGDDSVVAASSDKDNETRALITDGLANLEMVLEEYKSRTGEEINDLHQEISSLKSELLDFRTAAKSIDDNGRKRFLEFSDGISKNREIAEVSNNEIRSLVDSLDDQLQSVASGMERVESEISNKVEINRQETNKSVAELARLDDQLQSVASGMERVESEISNEVEINRQETNKSVAELARLDDQLQSVASGMERVESEISNEVEINRQETNKSVAELARLVSDNVIYLIISVAAVLLVLSLIFYFLRKKISVQRVDLTSSLVDTRKSLEEEFVRLDGKLVEILEAQIEISESEPNSSAEDVDHSLVIKVADEIVRIQKNITLMDEKTKGLKQLSASVTRIQDNVASNGYEIVEMLGAPYDEGMILSATFVLDEDLEEGEQIITRIIKPQINYQGVMIQSAQIEVSQGE